MQSEIRTRQDGQIFVLFYDARRSFAIAMNDRDEAEAIAKVLSDREMVFGEYNGLVWTKAPDDVPQMNLDKLIHDGWVADIDDPNWRGDK